MFLSIGRDGQLRFSLNDNRNDFIFIYHRQQDACDIFNTFLVNVAKDIGTSEVKVYVDHPSVSAIQENVKLESSFNLNLYPKSSFISKIRVSM